ncbi:MAG: hypothetical protein AAGA12_04930 [Pseudomonadota bacterium]
MSMFLSKEVREGLAAAQKADRKKRSRLRVQAGDRMIPILRFQDSSFAVDADEAAQLRGLVDIYDGGRHLYQALIVASEIDGPEMKFDFKRNTVAADRPALDFEQDEFAPVGYLPAQ